MPRKNTRDPKSGSNYYVSATGRSTNEGTQESPWSLAHAMKHVQPGDTVWLRGGTYRNKRGWNITASGTADQKITIKPFADETVTLDGSLPEFTIIGNAAWQKYGHVTSAHHVYRSAKPYTMATAYGGFIELGGEWYALATHKDYRYLLSDTFLWDFPHRRYLGPGIAQDPEGFLYIRLDNSPAQAQLDRPVPQIEDPDPRQHVLHIGNLDSYGVKITGSHLVFEKFGQIDTFGKCFVLGGRNQTDVIIHDCGGRPLFAGVRCAYVDQLTIDSCKFRGCMPGERWWVSTADIKVAKDRKGRSYPGEPVAAHVRKCGIDFGQASHVVMSNCVFEEFFDGILASAEYDAQGRLIDTAHHIEVRDNVFINIWDDAWQMIASLYQINFHHNLCLGAGPSVDAAGSTVANTDPGTIFIHHNVIDTTQRLVFWGRCDAPAEGMYESIPFSSHTEGTDPKNPEQAVYTLPRKVYHNTVVTGQIYSSNHPFVGWSLAGAAIRKVKYQAAHEVYNNIFLVGDGRPGGNYFDVTSGQEIYDGNVYWYYRVKDKPPTRNKAPTKSPWLLLQVVAGQRALKDAYMTVDELKGSDAFRVSQAYYPPGWENSGLSQDPMLDHATYKPMNPGCSIGAVNLRKTHWPGTDSEDAFRGAIPVPPVLGGSDGGQDGPATQ